MCSCLFENRPAEFFQLVTCQRQREILVTIQERHFDYHALAGRKTVLCIDRGFPETRRALWFFFGETFSSQILDDYIVDVVATQSRIAVRCEDLEHTVIQFENRNVECSASKVINGDFRTRLQLVQAI